jgi:DNA-binding beta-propeller fold protein YncE
MQSSDVEVYSAETFELEDRLAVRGLIDAVDMTSCPSSRCLFIADCKNGIVHRLETGGNASAVNQSRWIVSDKPYGLSVTPFERNVLVTCKEAMKLKLFTARGELVRQLDLQQSVVGSPRHAVQLATGQFVVCGGGTAGSVSLVNADGRRVVASFDGNSSDGGDDEYAGGHRFYHVAVDGLHGYTYAADYDGRRVAILNSDLVEVARVAVDIRREVKQPLRLSVDVDNNRLYIAEVGGGFTVCSIHQRFPGHHAA